jgi:hypothetical protein
MRIDKTAGFSMLACLLILSSCFKEEDMLPLPEAGEVETNEAVLGENYSAQVFYDLASNQLKSSNSVEAWDLGFSCNTDGFHIILNAAKMMYAGNSYDTSFNDVQSSEGIEMIFDKSDGNPDSTAIGEWYFREENQMHSHKYVYVIDRGNGENQQNMGMKKISISWADGKYQLRYADLDGSNENKVSIEKNESYNYTYFSFDQGVIPIAPPKDEWSLKFSRYATMLVTNDGEQVPYLVTGVLMNSNNVYAAADTTDFFNISLQDTVNYTFSKNLDFIGYDWKYYDFDSGVYTIVPDKNYILRNNDGFYFKLRFIDFYDEFGVKGSISFEVARL